MNIIPFTPPRFNFSFLSFQQNFQEMVNNILLGRGESTYIRKEPKTVRKKKPENMCNDLCKIQLYFSGKLVGGGYIENKFLLRNIVVGL